MNTFKAPFFLIELIGLAFVRSIRGQAATLLFNKSDAGVTRAITNRGLDITWADPLKMQCDLILIIC